MKAILRILLLFVLCAGAAEASAQITAANPAITQSKKIEESGKAEPGTYVLLFREEHKEIIELNDQLLHTIEVARRSSETVYLKINENILVKVLTPGTAAPPTGNDDFIYITNTEFNGLLQQAIN